MMHKKILFLDFDGVLNTEFYQDLLLSQGMQWQDEHGAIIDDEYVILDSQLLHFIMTNPFDGITEEVADRAIVLLNN